MEVKKDKRQDRRIDGRMEEWNKGREDKKEEGLPYKSVC